MPRYWFRPKRFGYGATATTWQGWALTFGFPLTLGGSILAMVADRAGFWAWMAWAVFAAGVTTATVKVARAKTDGDWRWRWN